MRVCKRLLKISFKRLLHRLFGKTVSEFFTRCGKRLLKKLFQRHFKRCLRDFEETL
jgi:hypothetical protein